MVHGGVEALPRGGSRIAACDDGALGTDVLHTHTQFHVREGTERRARGAHTNDRRYESKDSREMEKCSMSPAAAPAELLLLSLDVRARYRRGQVASFSTGDGGR